MPFAFARINSSFALVCSLGLISVACGDDDSPPLPAIDAGPDAATPDDTATTDTDSDTTDSDTTDTATATDTDSDITNTATDPDLTLVLDAGNGDGDVTTGTTDGDTTDGDTTDGDGDTTDGDGDTTDGDTTDGDTTDGDGDTPDAGALDADVPDADVPDADTFEPGDGGLDDTSLMSIRAGSFVELAAADAGTGARGRAQLVVTNSGETQVAVQVVGLAPSTSFPIHVHRLPCEFNQGGAHYKLNPSVDAESSSNEIWLEATTNVDGYGHARVVTDHEVRGDALSVVVHHPDSNERLMCADLSPESLSNLSGAGTLAPFAAAESIDQSLTGQATLLRGASGTSVSLQVDGLVADEEYVAHVHDLPCDVSNAGSHYKFDPTIGDTVEDNELWLSIDANDDGSALSDINVDHIARLDAQSVVLHRVDGDQQLRVACADFSVEGWEALATQGIVSRFNTGVDGGLAPTGEGSMLRNLDGITQVSITVDDLESNTEYGVHVHNLPCSVKNGGSHYKLDESVLDELESNEIWLNFTTDVNGTGVRTVDVAHVARPEAQSIVVHGTDNVRLGCVDLGHAPE